MAWYASNGCCGLAEISGLSSYATPEEALFSLLKTGGGYNHASQVPRVAHLVFTQASEFGMSQAKYAYGVRFAAFLEKEKLGTVVASKRKTNPNSGNLLGAWIWTLNHTALKAWFVKHQVANQKTFTSLPEGEVIQPPTPGIGG